jgi:ribosomal protein S18 acetylase RimI-like enzyme
MAGEVTIVRGGAERIPQLEPLWKALHHHHAAVAPHLAALEETWATGDRIGEVESLAVLPEYRSQGVGRALVHSVFEQLRRLDVTHWGVV